MSRLQEISASSAPARPVSATNFSVIVSTSATQGMDSTSGGCQKAAAQKEVQLRSTDGRRSGQTAVPIWLSSRKAPAPVTSGVYGKR